jgi:diadenylate cyclase
VEWLNSTFWLWSVIRTVLDIGIIALIIYSAYNILEETRAIQLIKGVVSVAVLYFLAWILNLSTLLWILNTLTPVVLIGMMIIFQPEIRRIFTRIGQQHLFRFRPAQAHPLQLESVLSSVEILAEHRRGALIVFSRAIGLKNIIDTGTRLNAELSGNLITTIFSHDTPLHDGAVVISRGKITAAGCFLPLSRQANISRSFGTRHRAALGLAEETDAVILIVSEETGAISLAHDSAIHYDLAMSDIKSILNQLLDIRTAGTVSAKEGDNAGYDE